MARKKKVPEEAPKKETAYDRYSRDLYALSKEELAKKYTLGEECQPQRRTDDGTPKDEPIQLDVYRYVVEVATGEQCGGVVRRERGRKVVEIADELRQRLDAVPGSQDETGWVCPFIDEYFGLSTVWQHKHSNGKPYYSGGCADVEWPSDYRWLACYAVTGGSEGHYIHIDFVRDDGAFEGVFLGKTFRGMAHAQRIAAKCAELLGA